MNWPRSCPIPAMTVALMFAWMSTAGLASTNAPGVGGAGTELFGLTNLWTLEITLGGDAWQALSARGYPRERGYGGMPAVAAEEPGLVNGIVRRFLGGGEGGDGGVASGGGTGGGRRRETAPAGESRYPWSTCTVVSAGMTLTNVGIRFKGMSSLVRSPNAYKRPFKLDFERGVKGRKFQGVDGLYLNNNVNDATQMREALAYELFRQAGLPASRTAFARVYLTIPGRFERRHLGLYTLVEEVGGAYVERHFGTRKGLLMKPDMMPGLPYLGDDWRAYEERYHPKGETDPVLGRAFMEFLRHVIASSPEGFGAGLEKYVDPRRFARFLALEAILANVDSFQGNGNNYLIHVHPDTRKAEFLPWDLNEAFGMHPVSGPSRSQMEFSVLRPNGDSHPLVERFVSDPRLGPVYRQECAWLLTNVFVAARLSATIDRISAVTRPVVWEESRRARADFERTVLGTLRPDEGDTSQPRHDREFNDPYRPWGFPDAVEVDNVPLKEWIAGREGKVRDQLEGRSRGSRPRPRLYY